MRDIREDLQERIELVKQQINAEQNQFEKLLKQLSSEQDSKVRYVKAELETVKKSSRSNIDGLAAQCPFLPNSKPSQQGGNVREATTAMSA